MLGVAAVYRRGHDLLRPRPAALSRGVLDRDPGRGETPDLGREIGDLLLLTADEVRVDRGSVPRDDDRARCGKGADRLQGLGPLEREGVVAQARGPDSSTRSPVSRTPASGTRTTMSPPVCPRPGWISSTARSPRSMICQVEKVRSGITREVSANSSQRGPPSRAARSMMPGPHSARLRAASSWAWTGTCGSASRNAAVPKVWSKCQCVVTTAWTASAPRRRISASTARPATTDASVSTTTSPRSPPTSVTFMSHHG